MAKHERKMEKTEILINTDWTLVMKAGTEKPVWFHLQAFSRRNVLYGSWHQISGSFWLGWWQVDWRMEKGIFNSDRDCFIFLVDVRIIQQGLCLSKLLELYISYLLLSLCENLIPIQTILKSIKFNSWSLLENGWVEKHQLLMVPLHSWNTFEKFG